MTASPISLNLRSVGVAVLAAAALALLPGLAPAACGDYVTIFDPRPAGHATDDPVAGHHPKLPCHGPGCSSRPSIPSAPVLPPVSDVSDTKALPADVGDPGATPPQGVEPPPPDLRPPHHPTSIYHPPRS